MELKTPLYDCHLAAGGKIVPFAGYLLPVQFPSGVIQEHMAVRTRAGLFDVSHMGEFLFEGPDALACINHLLTNQMEGMADGQVRYSPMPNERGGTVDDVLVYRRGETRYLMVVNASNRAKDADWVRAHLVGDVRFEDASDRYAQIALQGPRALAILSKFVDAAALPQKNYTFAENLSVAGQNCLVSRTGYTGEDGFELYTAPEGAPALWDALLAAGADEGLIPCGLGARDTLRLESAMPLYGHELGEDISPLEAGLSMFVKLDKPEFVGKQALLDTLVAGEPARARIGLGLMDKGIAREGSPVLLNGARVGVVTSGTHCPFLGRPVAMALIERAAASPEAVYTVDVRGRMLAARTEKLPFYKRAKPKAK